MKREKLVIYDSCDFCDSVDETTRQCDICDMYYCREHGRAYRHGDQIYTFCDEHYELVRDIIEITGIPIGFIKIKLRGDNLVGVALEMWDERGYETRWNDYMRQNK